MISHIFKATSTMISLLLLALAASSGNAFQNQLSFVTARGFANRHNPPSSSTTSPIVSYSSSTTQRHMSFAEISSFYSTYPLESAVLTCGLKASVADGIAQAQSWTDSKSGIEFKRTLAYVLYGGIFVGLMCHLEYDYLFPVMFGPDSNSMSTFVAKVLFDNFVSAPLVWLPPAYIIKSFVYDFSIEEALQRYMHDIQKEGLLNKYWTIWLPAQSVSFSVVPDHLRVAFMASISFFWFILFSMTSAKNETVAEEVEEAVVSMASD